MPPRKKRRQTKSNTSNVDEDPLFEELPPGVAANAVAAVTQLSQEAAVDEAPRRCSPRRKTSTTAPSSGNIHDNVRTKGQEEEAATAPSSSNNHDDSGAEGQEEEAQAGTTDLIVKDRTDLSRLFFGNALYAEAYANNPSEAYNQFFLQLSPRLSRFELPTTQYATTGLYETDFPLENDAFVEYPLHPYECPD